MMSVLDRLQDFAGWLASGKTALPEVVAIPDSRCTPNGSSGVDILKDDQYFTVTVNELFLDRYRFGLTTYVPMVIVTVSFLYGGKRISVPTVVGPGLLESNGQTLPQGILLEDTTVAGPYPYRGGPVAISLIFYRLRHRDYARELLRVVEGVSRAIGPAADLGLLAKVGGTLIGGLDDLLGMGETEPIAGQRIELSPLKPGGFRTCFSALIDAEDRASVDRLHVNFGRLRLLNSDGSFEKYKGANYVLYSIQASDRRDDETSLALYSLYERALSDASQGGPERWKSAKATFSELWQQMILSPDLTKSHAKKLLEQWRAELRDAHETGCNTKIMSLGNNGLESERVAVAAKLLDEE
jgi:hypothetical protein